MSSVVVQLNSRYYTSIDLVDTTYTYIFGIHLNPQYTNLNPGDRCNRLVNLLNSEGAK
jgi:hypothetical protein